MANVVSAVAAAEQEFRACAALREGGTSPQAQAAAAQAAKLYGAALKALHRFGATSRRFWESIEASLHCCCVHGARHRRRPPQPVVPPQPRSPSP